MTVRLIPAARIFRKRTRTLRRRLALSDFLSFTGEISIKRETKSRLIIESGSISRTVPAPVRSSTEKDFNSDWLTKEELRQKLNLPSVRSIDEMMRKRKISFVRIGWRTVRFDYAVVMRDLAKLTIRAV